MAFFEYEVADFAELRTKFKENILSAGWEILYKEETDNRLRIFVRGQGYASSAAASNTEYQPLCYFNFVKNTTSGGCHLYQGAFSAIGNSFSDLAKQEGNSTSSNIFPYTYLWDRPMKVWLSLRNTRVLMVVKVLTTYRVIYNGFILPFNGSFLIKPRLHYIGSESYHAIGNRSGLITGTRGGPGSLFGTYMRGPFNHMYNGNRAVPAFNSGLLSTDHQWVTSLSTQPSTARNSTDDFFKITGNTDNPILYPMYISKYGFYDGVYFPMIPLTPEREIIQDTRRFIVFNTLQYVGVASSYFAMEAF